MLQPITESQCHDVLWSVDRAGAHRVSFPHHELRYPRPSTTYCWSFQVLIGLSWSSELFVGLLGNSTTIGGWEKDKVATLARRRDSRDDFLRYFGHLGVNRVVSADKISLCELYPLTPRAYKSFSMPERKRKRGWFVNGLELTRSVGLCRILAW